MSGWCERRCHWRELPSGDRLLCAPQGPALGGTLRYAERGGAVDERTMS